MLRENVGGVHLASDFAKLYRAAAHFLLYPKSVRCDVPQLAKSLPRTDTHGCGRVGPYADWQFDAQVAQDTLLA